MVGVHQHYHIHYMHIYIYIYIYIHTCIHRYYMTYHHIIKKTDPELRGNTIPEAVLHPAGTAVQEAKDPADVTRTSTGLGMEERTSLQWKMAHL